LTKKKDEGRLSSDGRPDFLALAGNFAWPCPEEMKIHSRLSSIDFQWGIDPYRVVSGKVIPCTASYNEKDFASSLHEIHAIRKQHA